MIVSTILRWLVWWEVARLYREEGNTGSELSSPQLNKTKSFSLY